MFRWFLNKIVYLGIFGISAGIMAAFLILVMDNFLRPEFGLKNIFIIFCGGTYLCSMVGLFFVFLKRQHDKNKNKNSKSNKIYLKERI